MELRGDFIQKLAVLYLVVWTISPPLGVDMIYRYLAILSVGVWGLIAIGRGYLKNQIRNVQLYAVLFAAAVGVIAYVQHGDIDGILQQIAMYIMVISFLMNIFYQNGSWHELKWIVPIVLILLAVFNFRTAQVLISDPGLARRIVRADADTYDYMRRGVGGYGLIYSQVCVFPALLVWIKSAFRNNKSCFAIGCVWLVTFFMNLLNAGYSIAVFTVCVSGLVLILYRRRSIAGAVILTVCIFVVFLDILLSWDSFREMLLAFFDGTKVAAKINDLVSSVETGTIEDSISSRITAYSASFDILLEYPIIGSLWHASGGGHSAVLDTIAKYGILGGYMYIRMLFYVPNVYKRYSSHPMVYRISNAVIIATLLVSMLNTIPYNIMCMILLVLPLLYEDIIKWERIEA